MGDRKLEASQTVVEAMARTEAILRQAEMREYRPARRDCPRSYRRGFAAWLAYWRTRISGWTA